MEIRNDIKIYVSNTADTINSSPLPNGITNFSPYIKWQLPQQIKQIRYGIRITHVQSGLFLIYKNTTTDNVFQLPIGNGFNNNWIGVCFIEVQISQKLQYNNSDQFQFTSGGMQYNNNGFFVIDPTMQQLTIDSNIQYFWDKSLDQNTQQTIFYQLQVSKHPLFLQQDIVINQTNINDVYSGVVSFSSIQLPIGIYFYRVRAFDGYDYSLWSIINAFKITEIKPPTLSDFEYYITNNTDGDVIISFNTNYNGNSFTSIVLTYSYNNQIGVQYPCTLRETSHIVPNGFNSLTWISSQDINTDSDLFIYIYAYYSGNYSQKIFLPIRLQNSKYLNLDTSASDVNVDFIVKYDLKLRRFVYEKYVGWNNELYIHKLCQCISCKIKNSLLDNNVYFRIKNLIKEKQTLQDYIGWNSQLKHQVEDNEDDEFTSNITKPNIHKKYFIDNNIFLRLKTNGAIQFSLYADGRNFNRNDDQSYVITDPSSDYSYMQDISAGLSDSSNKSDQYKVAIHPPYQKATLYHPVFKQSIKLPNSVTNKQGHTSSVNPNTNWTYYKQDMDWSATFQVQCQPNDQDGHRDSYGKYHKKVFVKIWGGQLKSDGKDNNLRRIINSQNINNIYDSYSNTISSMTIPDGKIVYQDDNYLAPQYTLYPDIVTSSGYPPAISQDQLYYLKLQNIYIKKYKIQKGGSEQNQFGYKDFSVKKKDNFYHKYSFDQNVPKYLIYNNITNTYCDQNNQICYNFIQNVYLRTNNASKKYKNLPIIIKKNGDFIVYDKIEFIDQNNEITTKNIQKKIYFQEYYRVYNGKRGKSPQFSRCQKCQGGFNNGVTCSYCNGTGHSNIDPETQEIKQIKQTLFSNVAVPYYVLSKNAVYSSNQFNNKKQVFDLKFKIKRDKRRYVLGHYYSWDNRQTNQSILLVLNNFLKTYYSDCDFYDIKHQNLIIHYKYKYLSDDSVDEILVKNYIYVPVYTQEQDQNGQISYVYKRAWFYDNSYSKFSSVQNNKKFNWDSIDNDDYLLVHRQINNLQMSTYQLSNKKNLRNMIIQGTNLNFSTQCRQNYYSDKSKYGIQSYSIVGNLSDNIQQKTNDLEQNNQTNIDRIIYLNHKNVIKESIVVYYLNDNNINVFINKYNFIRSNNYNNDYILLQQNDDYINKKIFVQYQYLNQLNHCIETDQFESIYFSSYDQFVYLSNDLSVQSLKVYYNNGDSFSQIEEGHYQLQYIYPTVSSSTSSQYVQNSLNQMQEYYSLSLSPYYLNKQLSIIYNYHDIEEKEPIFYKLDSQNITQQNQFYVINNINSNIVHSTILLKTIDNNNYLKQIQNYDLTNNKFTVNNNNCLYKKIQLHYDYELYANYEVIVKFEGFYTNLSMPNIDINTVKIYYLLHNEIKRNITDYFDLNIITNNNNNYIMVILTESDIQNLDDVFNNVLYAEYTYTDEYENVCQKSQVLYLTPPTFSSELIVDGENYQLYLSGRQLNKEIYSVTYNYIQLIVKQSYNQVLDYLNKQLILKFRKKINHSDFITTSSFSKKINSLEQSIELDYFDQIDFETFKIYYYDNDIDFIFKQIEDYDFQIASDKKGFLLTNSDYLGKELIFDYQYQVKSVKHCSYRYDITNNNEIIIDSDVQEESLIVYQLYNNNMILVQNNNYNYIYDRTTNKITFYNKQLIEIVVQYNHIYQTTKYMYNSFLLTNHSNILEIKKSYLNEIKSPSLNDGFIGYQIEQLTFDMLKNMKLYYCDYVTEIKQFELLDMYETQDLDQLNFKKIVLKKNIKDISDYIYLKYCILGNNTNQYAQKITFNNVYEHILLEKKYVSQVSLSYDTNLIDSSYYNCNQLEEKSYISLTNKYLNKQLKISYQKLESKQLQILFDYSGDLQFLTLDKLNYEYIQVFYQNYNQDWIIIDDNSYIITSDENNIYIDFKNIVSNYNIRDYLIDKKIKVIISYFNKIPTNNLIEKKLIYNDNYNVFYFAHKQLNSFIVKYYDNNKWNVVDQNAYNFYNNEFVRTLEDGQDYQIKQHQYIDLNNVYKYPNIKFYYNTLAQKYKNKPLKLQYTTLQISYLQKTNIYNTNSLFFSKQKDYIVLSNKYIDKNTFSMYYEGDQGITFIPSEDYILNIGTQYYNGTVFLNKQSLKYQEYLQKRIHIYYKYTTDPKIVYNQQNQRFPYLDFIFQSKIIHNLYNYVQGYSYNQHIGFYDRMQPWHLNTNGFKIQANVTQPIQYVDLRFVYLQSFWDAYNTIHIQGNLDVNSYIILQYCQVENNGYINQDNFIDFITYKSIYKSSINHYVLPQLTYSVFVDTYNESLFKDHQLYVLRLRLYNDTTNTFSSQWRYSNVFQIDHDAINPVNITNISYDAWTNNCKIQFRIDDTQGDLYDLLYFYYTSDGRTWNQINPSNISGKKTYLQSNKKGETNIIHHELTWDISGYNLKPSSSYRIKITATYTKFNNGDGYKFTWQVSQNPFIDFYQSQLFLLRGGRQYQIYVQETYKIVQNNDGTISYQQLQNPIAQWRRVQPYKYYFLDNDGNNILDDDGNPTYQMRNYNVVNGRLQQLYEQLDMIKGRPNKNINENGQLKVINWGYLEYCDDNGNIIDYDGYRIWLSQIDPQYNKSRSILINQIQIQIDSITQKIQLYQNKLLQCQMLNRRQLIRQGYYTNGFLNNQYNQSDPTIFDFRIKLHPTSKEQQQWIKQSTQENGFQLKYNFQLDFYNTYNSQYNSKPLRDLYVNENGDDITAGIDQQNLNNLALYNGNYSIPKNYLPGHQNGDYNPNGSDYSFEYYWRIRPYIQFYADKRQIARINITDIYQTSRTINVQFTVTGQQNLNVLQLPLYSSYYSSYYYCFLTLKSQETQDKIILLQPNSDLFSNNGNNNNIVILDQKSSIPNVVFATDRLRDEEGVLYERQNGYKNWIPFDQKTRQRPCVILFQNQYYMFYDKNSSNYIANGQKVVCLSLSKNGTVFGQYSQVYPYLTYETLQQKISYKQMINPFVIRQKNGFRLFATAKNDQGFQILNSQSDFYGDKFDNFINCQGLEGCDCVSVVKQIAKKTVVTIDSYGNKTQVIQDLQCYIMLCLYREVDNSLEQTESKSYFKFYFSQDAISWKTIKQQNLSSIQEGVYETIEQTIQFVNIDLTMFENIYAKQNQQLLSPYMFKDQNQNYYIYYCSCVGNKYCIYRKNYNGLQWSNEQKIVEDAFNPTVIQDYYYGQKLHRLYYNKIISKTFNRQTQNIIIINNCYISKDFNKELKMVKIDKIISTQTNSSFDNITSGNFLPCENCNGTGIASENTCNKCNGIGYIQKYSYKINISDSILQNGKYQIDKCFIKLNPRYKQKNYRLYSNYIDYKIKQDHGVEINYTITPNRKWKYLDL